MRRKINASDKKNGPDNHIRDDRENTKRQIGYGNSKNRALHEGQDRAEGQHGRAKYRNHAGEKFCPHVVPLPRQFIGRIPKERKK